ncbi:hypothetical protein ACIG56_11705 [Nocardia fusca]|uniref:hypothetical protein n=1 Tax=Nocardia fusca TaxID=941183 RepID=UPI0037C89882
MSGEVASWETLTGLASEGKLLVEDGIAFECATLCAEFIGVLEAVGQDGLFDGASAVTASHPAPLESLNALDVQLTQLSNDLYDRIGNSDTSYLAALENMLQLLKEAGKKYQEAEDGSSDDFDLDSVTPASGTDVTIASHNGDIHSDEFLLKRLENAELSRSAGLWIEDHEEQTYDTLYAVGDHIRTSGIAGLYENLGTKWYRWGDMVRNSAGDFVNTLVGRTAGAWEKEGSQGAIAASHDFEKQLESLVEAMWRVADSYRYAALWLASTEEAMPKDRQNHMGTYRDTENGTAPYDYLDEHSLVDEYTITYKNSTAPTQHADGYYADGSEMIVIIDDPTPHYQEKLKNTYIAGIGETAEYFPVLPEYVGGTPPPDPEPTPEPDPNPAPGPDPNPIPGNPVGNPGGAYGPPASGLPSAEEEFRRLAAGIADQEERAARELAEQQSQQMVPQLMQAAQQGLGMVQQALQDAAQRSMANSVPPGGLPTSELPPGIDLPKTAGLPGLGAGGPGGSPGAGLSNPGGSRPPIDTARLFPRAGLPGTSTPQAGLGGTQASGMPAGSGAPMGGAPMGGGGGAPGGGSRGQGDDKHERAKYLDRADNIDEGLGETLDMTRPVVGEAVNRPPAERPQPVVRRQRAESPQAPAPAPVPARPSNSEEPVVLPGREGA